MQVTISSRALFTANMKHTAGDALVRVEALQGKPDTWNTGLLKLRPLFVDF